MKKKLVVVGGGYVGFEVAKALDASADVTLIEQREAFVTPPAAIRALVQPELLDQLVFPYDRLLKNGRVIRARATRIAPDGVTLADGSQVTGDYIVVATGSTYAAPFKPVGDSIDGFLEANRAVGSDLKAAQSVAIVGAGAVGSELAGEIATAYPQKSVTLISSDAQLFPAYPRKLGARLQAKLEGKGVSVILGQRATDLAQISKPYAGAVTLTDGRTIKADLIFPVIGAKPDATVLDTLPGVTRTPAGRVETDKWLRAAGQANIFVAGDVADTGDGMTIVAISRQAPWLIKLLESLVKGGAIESHKPYAPWKTAPILLPLGPSEGNSWLFATVGDWLTSKIKGRDIFLPKYRKAFGYADKT